MLALEFSGVLRRGGYDTDLALEFSEGVGIFGCWAGCSAERRTEDGGKLWEAEGGCQVWRRELC